MAFNRFENGNKAKTVKSIATTVEGEPKPRNTPWATIEANGANGYILHIGVNGVTAYDLRPQDRVFLSFDPETHRIGIQRSDGRRPCLEPARRQPPSAQNEHHGVLPGEPGGLPPEPSVQVGREPGRTGAPGRRSSLTLPEPKTRKPR